MVDVTFSKKFELDISTHTTGHTIFNGVIEKIVKKNPSERKNFSKLTLTPLYRAVTHVIKWKFQCRF
jgi:hypothetical protein